MTSPEADRGIEDPARLPSHVPGPDAGLVAGGAIEGEKEAADPDGSGGGIGPPA